MSTLSTHILDTALGQPASNVTIALEQLTGEGWQQIASGKTDDDGRLKTLTPDPIVPGHYRLTAEIGEYFAQSNRPSLYLTAQIDFVIPHTGEHFHLPYLITPNSWSTYRGS